MAIESLADEGGYSGARTAEIVGISYRQLDYWARTDLVRPSVEDAKGSGSRRRYSYTDLLELRVIKSLLDSGLKLESVREVFSYLHDNLARTSPPPIWSSRVPHRFSSRQTANSSIWSSMVREC